MPQLKELIRPPEGELFADSQPTFAPLKAPGEGHIGVIDVGSNSVRLVVFEGSGRSPAPLYNEKVLCGLGAGLAESGVLDPEGRERARAALRRFARLAGGMGVMALAGVATSAVRDAGDGQDFVRQVARETNIRLRVVSGEEEARLAALGVIFGQPDAEGVVADLGGASLELCRVGEGRAGPGISMPLGPLRFGRDGHGRGAPEDAAAIARADLEPVAPRFSVPGGVLYLVGGGWRALARVHMHRSAYPVPILHEYEIAAADLAETATWAAAASTEDIAAIPGVSSARVANMPGAAAILGELIAALGPETVTISGFGLREGVCFAQMHPSQRALDPLFAACREQERRRARFPGFGGELAIWLNRLIEPADAREEALITAAAHLSDVNWRTHPDYRAVACVETVTRMHVTGGGHRGRGFLATALLMRHKGGRKAVEREPLAAILSEADRARAALVGKAMRLGATLSGAAPGLLADCPMTREADGLLLRVPPRAAELVTGDVEKRIAAVADLIGCGWRLERTGG